MRHSQKSSPPEPGQRRSRNPCIPSRTAPAAGRSRQWLGAVLAAGVWTACRSLPLREDDADEDHAAPEPSGSALSCTGGTPDAAGQATQRRRDPGRCSIATTLDLPPSVAGFRDRGGLWLPALPHVPRIPPQHPSRLLDRQPATEGSERVFLGSLEECRTEALVQAGAIVSRPRFPIIHVFNMIQINEPRGTCRSTFVVAMLRGTADVSSAAIVVGSVDSRRRQDGARGLVHRARCSTSVRVDQTLARLV